MKTALERLQAALKHQQRYLSVLSRISPGVIRGVGAAVMLLLLIAYHLRMPGGLPPAVWILGGVFGWVIWVAIATGSIWLCRTFARWQIANYEEAIEELEREQ
jgi:hypothetical protein